MEVSDEAVSPADLGHAGRPGRRERERRARGCDQDPGVSRSGAAVAVPPGLAELLSGQLAPVVELCVQLRRDLAEAREEHRSTASLHAAQIAEMRRELATWHAQRANQDRELERDCESPRDNEAAARLWPSSGAATAPATAATLASTPEPAGEQGPLEEPEPKVGAESGSPAPVPAATRAGLTDEERHTNGSSGGEPSTAQTWMTPPGATLPPMPGPGHAAALVPPPHLDLRHDVGGPDAAPGADGAVPAGAPARPKRMEVICAEYRRVGQSLATYIYSARQEEINERVQEQGLIAWYVEQVEEDIQTETELYEAQHQVQLVINRLIDKDRVNLVYLKLRGLGEEF